MSITGRISEQKILKIREVNCQNPIALRWKNKLGGWNFFVFEGGFDETIMVTDEVTATAQRAQQEYRPYDIEYMEAFERVLSKQSRDKITCACEQLDASDRAALRGLVDSPRILMLTNPLTWDTLDSSGTPVGVKEMEVRIEGGAFNFGDQDHNLWSLYFTIIKQPNSNIQL